MTLSHFLILAGLLFGVGLTGAVVRRNILVVYMSLEMMLTAAMLMQALRESQTTTFQLQFLTSL